MAKRTCTSRPLTVVPLLAAASLFTACTSHHASAAGPTSAATGPGPAAGSTPAPLNSSQASVLAKNLAAGTDTGLRAAIVLPSGQPLDTAAAAQLQAAGPITFAPGTFHRLGARDATVAGTMAHPPAGQPARWTFTLAYVGGQWKVLDAEPAR